MLTILTVMTDLLNILRHRSNILFSGVTEEPELLQLDQPGRGLQGQ